MKTKLSFNELAEFLDMPMEFINNIVSIQVWEGEAVLEIEYFVKDGADKVLNFRGEPVKNVMRIALVK